MSDSHNEHESPIRTPGQLITAIIAAFVVPIIVIVLLVKYVSSDNMVGAGSDNSPQAIAARLKPVGDIGFTLKDASAPRQLQAGADVYKTVCAACHASGAAGAPKVGDAAAWGPRVAQGVDTLISHALKGLRAMPAKGGNPNLDDKEVAGAVVYMANQSGANFKDPNAK